MRKLLRSFAAVCLLSGLTACSSKPPPRLRTPAEIDADRRSLTTLYLTGKTGKKVLAPMNALPFVDQETHEVCWPAYCCTNPDCPGKGKGADGDPFVFAHVDPLLEAGGDGQAHRIELPDYVNVSDEVRKRGGFEEPTCPECIRLRSPATLTATVRGDKNAYAERQKYRSYIKPYYPPETVKRMQALDAELAEWNAYVQERQKRPLQHKEFANEN